MSSQRLFFGLWPDASARERVAAVAERLPAHRGRINHPLDLHLTLAFLGDVEAERRPCVEQAAGRVRVAPFQLCIDRLGYWTRPRILWVGPAQTPEPLVALAGQLQAGLEPCGLEPERRPYVAHVTLARKAGYVRPRELDEPICWPAREFVLATSQQGRGPPRYRVIETWPLVAG